MKKLNRETLAEQIADAILDFIETENLDPGDPLPSTAQLAATFDVSRPVIREALKTLEGREIVQVSNGRNAIVKPMTSDSLKTFFARAIALNKKSLVELLEVRRGLEVQSAILAAQHITQDELAQIEQTLFKMQAHLNNPEAYTDLDVQFHLQIASATRNRLMYFLIESIRDSLANTIQEGLRSRISEQQLVRVQQLHAAVIDGLRSHDAAKASAAMSEHFDDAIDAIVRAEIFDEGISNDTHME